jgi:hypothetical protein
LYFNQNKVLSFYHINQLKIKEMENVPQTLFGKQLRANPKAHELSIALNMVGLNVNIPACELILRAQESMLEMKGNFDLKTACKIQVEVDEKYAEIKSDFNKSKTN